jgi:hypothetical protein
VIDGAPLLRSNLGFTRIIFYVRCNRCPAGGPSVAKHNLNRPRTGRMMEGRGPTCGHGWPATGGRLRAGITIGNAAKCDNWGCLTPLQKPKTVRGAPSCESLAAAIWLRGGFTCTRSTKTHLRLIIPNRMQREITKIKSKIEKESFESLTVPTVQHNARN